MLWPSSTPDRISLPALDDENDDDSNNIIAIDLCNASHVLIALTRKAVYIYRLKPLCPVVVYVRSKESLAKYGPNSALVVKPDGRYVAIHTNSNTAPPHLFILEIGSGDMSDEDGSSSIYSFNGGGGSSPTEVCRFVKVPTPQSTDVGGGQNQEASAEDMIMKTSARETATATATAMAAADYDATTMVDYNRRPSYSDILIGTFPGPGEAMGVRELKLRLSGVISEKESSLPIVALIPLEDYLMVSTAETTKFFPWFPSSPSDAINSIYTIIHSELEWMGKSDKRISHISRSKAMSLFSVTTEGGSVYSATLTENKPSASSTGKATGPRHRSSSAGSSSSSGSMSFNGHIFHSTDDRRRPSETTSSINHSQHLPQATSSAINARFSEIAVACTNGSIYLYNIRDYSGNSKFLTSMDPPSMSSAGSILCLQWSADGCALLVGYEHGWILYSIYGMTNASSFLIKKDQMERETWLGGIQQASWSIAGDCIFLLPVSGGTIGVEETKTNGTGAAREIWALGLLRWSAVGNWTHDNLQRPSLLKESNKILIYRGQEQPDLTTIARDALLWLSVTIPGSYVGENWPIKYVSSSADGRYIAVAGMRGLAHYSLYSGRWKLFVDDNMDREFSVRAGMIWYGHYLIVAVDTDQYKYELRIYSRELELSPDNVVFSEELIAPILKFCIIADMLVVYTHDNMLSFYRLTSIRGNDIRSLDLEHKISLSGLVHSPARVRAIDGFPGPVVDSNSAFPVAANHIPIVLLVDGMLMILDPSPSGTSYSKHLLHHSIEYYFISPPASNPVPTSTASSSINNNYSSSSSSTPASHSMLWAFDGKDMLIWLKDLTIPENRNERPISVPVESYPLAVLMDKGILTGIETDTVTARDQHFTYFKFSTSTQLFVPYVLESYLKFGDFNRAIAIANEYKHLKYFSHILEILLYKILISDEDAVDKKVITDKKKGAVVKSSSLLLRATDLVVQFPQMLDVFLGCTRKTEVKYWKQLFEVIGSPQELFERCILVGKLKTAAGYLLVLHSLSQGNDDGKDNTIRLFKLAYESGDWELCKELSRFLTNVDRK